MYSPLAGLQPGMYRQWDHDFEVLPIGKIVVAGTPYLGGSWAFTDLCLGNVLKLGETSLADMIDLGVEIVPARLLGLAARAHRHRRAGKGLILFDYGDVSGFQLMGDNHRGYNFLMQAGRYDAPVFV